MESGYDLKFEEMKKYIPFLENMIRRLENTSSGLMNPRQAQLSKIRSLRDLLLDKNKRMKMENLLKCEQVLINLYSKVEQRDTLPGINKAPQNMSPPPPRENLDQARRKLIEAAKAQSIEDPQETLPEIARANQTEVACSGSKEPALFQRRPNKSASSSVAMENSRSSSSKRNYTRVLVSPEPAPERRLRSPENSLYQRRSPRKPHESGSHHKKERKKERKRSGSKGSRSDSNLNITLQVPEESLGSLDTEDIFDRIIDCNSADVDISTLRDLRAQILGELKQTGGVKEDISDLILKSYRSKKKKRSGKKRHEVEEGELSDSESEAIASIYGSLVIVDGEQVPAKEKKSSTTEKDANTDSRKIQIRLVISNTDKDKEINLGMETNVDEKSSGAPNVHLEEVIPRLQDSSLNETSQNQVTSSEPIIKAPVEDTEHKLLDMKDKGCTTESSIHTEILSSEVHEKFEGAHSPKKQNKANFYNPIAEPDLDKSDKTLCDPRTLEEKKQVESDDSNKDKQTMPLDPEEYLKLTCDPDELKEFEDQEEQPKEAPKIPFLSEPCLEPKPPKEPENVVSEIDILQALKNEILSESLSLPGTEVATPALHVPKITKVSNVKEISTKKTISLEKYKQQSQMPKSKQHKKLFSSKPTEDLSQKPSRGLTAKECERFNFAKLILDDLSDEEDGKLTSADVEDIYADLAPQSPDADLDLEDCGNESPVIIPADPVKPPVVVATRTDVDMRAMPMNPLPQNVIFSPNPSILPVVENKRPSESLQRPSDPRKRKDLHNPSLARDHSNSPVCHPGGTPRQNFPNMTPSMTPNARSFEMTPSHPNFEDQPRRKHVYAPLWDSNERDQTVGTDRPNDIRGGYNNTSDSRSPMWEEQNTCGNSVMRDERPELHSNRDRYQQRTRVDPRLTERREDGYSRADCPPTPSHYFGRADYPGTPSHPLTPSHPFGSDCPLTPSHPFGMSDIPRTPSHPFGRSEYPGTPNHPFGRSECPTTPIHPFGRATGRPQDPRCNRKYDEDDSQHRDKNLYNSYDKYRQHSGASEPYNRYVKEQDGKNDNKNMAGDRSGGRQFCKEQRYERCDGRLRAPSVGRMGRDFEGDRGHKDDYDTRRGPRHDVSEVGCRRPRERSVGRTMEQNCSNSRAPSIGKTYCPVAPKTVSVESLAGRSFTIDTSVKATFQEFNFNDLNLNSSFDARRQRAASVGRSLNRESSVGRTFNREGSVGRSLIREGNMSQSRREGSVGRNVSSSNDDKFHINRNYGFKRAQSVGRDLSSHSNYSDHQARFESFKAMATARSNKSREKSDERSRESHKNVSHKETPKPQLPLNPRDPRSKNDVHIRQKDRHFMDSQRSTRPSATTDKTMKHRDPRMRKNSKLNHYSDYRHDPRLDSRERREHGIVYTNDNIARGNILGPGYGVKNYKIPKIKRPVEETPPLKVADMKDKAEAKLNENEKKTSIAATETRKELEKSEKKLLDGSAPQPKEFKKASNSRADTLEDSIERHKQAKKDQLITCNATMVPQKIQDNKTNKDAEKTERKSITDSTPQPQRKNRRRRLRKDPTPPKDSERSSPIRTRRSRRAAIYDSESDNYTDSTSDISDLKAKGENAVIPRTSSPAKESELDDLQFSFDMQDDLELFPENITSDTVIDNINDLIADLDKDLSTTKPDDTINTFDSILQSLKGTDSTNLLKESHQDFQSYDISSVETLVPSRTQSTTQEKDMSEVKESINEDVNKTSNASETNGKITEVNESQRNLQTTPVQSIKEKESSDVVSTSISEDHMLEKVQTLAEQQERHSEVCSTPDSTINTEEISEQVKCTSKSLPDSTNEAQLEMNSDISSTLDHSEKCKETMAELNSSKIGSLGSILSLLQDKTKIKELLSLLDDQVDNEKIKKKLEKLSEIVSDDDEPIDDNTTTEIADKDNTLVEKVVDDTAKQDIKELENETAVENKEEISIGTAPDDKSNLVETLPLVKSKEAAADEKLETLSEETSVETGTLNKEVLNDGKAQLTENEGVGCRDKDENLSKEKSIVSETLDIEMLGQAEDHKRDECVNDDIKTDDTTKKEENVPTDNDSDNEPIVLKAKKIKKLSKGKSTKETVKKRITRSTVCAQKRAPLKGKKPNAQAGKKKSTELEKLQDDIRDMFISNEVLNATGIRMCRLAKLVEQKDKISSEDSSPTKTNESSARSDTEGCSVTPSPVVVLEKINKALESTSKPLRKKPGPKPKALNVSKESEKGEPLKTTPKFKPGPKSKTKLQGKKDLDPYDFESDSVSEATKASDNNNSSDSDNESLASSESVGSTDLLVEMKSKPKRKRNSWNKGVIKTKKSKKNAKPKEVALPNERPSSSASESHKAEPTPALPIELPDWNCFIDKSYCFSKNNKAYMCRLCGFEGEAIVHHYKKHHPHYEIPLSRMNLLTAKEAIKQSMVTNFQQISKVPVPKYVCRFCFASFDDKRKTILEAFFWHVVSTHTGEYKQLCAECTTVKKCTFMLDIPPPPHDKNGLLMGYICGKCNYTQVSLENLKNHVSLRHNDEETEVYTISLSVMTQKMVDSLKSQIPEDSPRALRSLRSKPTVNYDDEKQSIIEHETEPRRKSVQSRISFEDDTEKAPETNDTLVKSENEDEDDTVDDSRLEDRFSDHTDEPAHLPEQPVTAQEVSSEALVEPPVAKIPEEPISDVFLQPHFKVTYKENGNKEYLCCINGDDHYKTTLLISMKKHVQIKHKERWDGFCSICKVIVMPQGRHDFKQLLAHLLDTHMGNFPELEKAPDVTPQVVEPEKEVTVDKTPEPPRTYINVRPLTQLISPTLSISETAEDEDCPIALPKIQSVISLNDEVLPAPPTELATEIENYQEQAAPPKEVVEYKYEEVVQEVMSNKHQIVLDSMLSQQKLTHNFKCAGRYCSFTCNEAEFALVHASTHSRIGGADAFRCCYCSFDASGNAIDLVSHVFKEHASCKFTCRDCFYRASSSPLVEAHFARVHGCLGPGVVLQAPSSLAPTGAEVEGLLSRQEAVRYYSCCFGKGDDGCIFKTFTPGKFCEHLLQKHSDASTYPCDECTFTGATPTLLVQHLQSHGLQLYQCTWCVYGADTEADMLAHASLRHPTRRPQAYLRHKVETKAGVPGPRYKVLPFVHIGKTNVITPVVVAPDKAKPDNPSREADRALELEKLLKDTTKIIEESAAVPTAESQDEEDIRRLECVLDQSPPIVYPEIPADAMILPFDSEPLLDFTGAQSQDPLVLTVVGPLRQMTPPPVQMTPPPLQISPAPIQMSPAPIQMSPAPTPSQTTPPQVLNQVPIAEQSTPKLKVEMVDEDVSSRPKRNHTTEVIYCLDSDDDEAPPPEKGSPVIDLSDENESNSSTATAPAAASVTKSASTDIRLSTVELYRCQKCQMLFKTGHSLKRHYFDCYSVAGDILSCAHCQFTSENKNHMIKHYGKQHGPLSVYICGICNRFQSDSKESVIGHVSASHGSTITLNYHLEKRGELNESVNVALPASEVGPKPRGRRKRSSGEPISTTPAKLKRYGLNTLPINQIFDEPVQCSLCDFSNKVRQNMIRHFQLHSQQQNVPQNAPVNPVPHLETNEMHFDKMLNLASSSIVTRAGDTPESSSRYPGFVPERERYACGAKDCSYISINEAMLKCHWETLHSGSNDYHCVHCPPIQQLDTSRPLTAGRIIAHLKMHDVKLFGCGACMFYHHQQHLVEKHVTEKHNGNARVKIIRGSTVAAPTPAPSPSAGAPTMDLKPWQCGLCQFKSMLRPEVVEHCSKMHQSKFQFKCAFCPWRSSAIENVTKHHANSHSGQQGDVFYFYYREGSIPDEDGMPRWMKQRQKTNPQDPEVKAEKDPPPPSKELPPPAPRPEVDLNLVKKETEEPESVEALCKKFGPFCEPNGLKYKCSLCKQATEDNKEAMQSHLYEELKYRKWGCRVCSYKAFHQKGLKEHAFHEHRQNLEPVELPSSGSVETWVAKLLEHQENIIKTSLANLQKQKQMTPEKEKNIGNEKEAPKTANVIDAGISVESLEQALGKFGAPGDGMFACPKCDYKTTEETQMSMHLISELDKLRWRCSVCQEYFQIYHEAQLHCKSVHPGQAARTIPTTRDPVLRNAWVNGVLKSQRETLKSQPTAIVPGAVVIESPEKDPDAENSLLVFRYEETVPTPEETLAKRSEECLARRIEETKRSGEASSKRREPVYKSDDDSDDERLVIDEVRPELPGGTEKCPYCEFRTRNAKGSMHCHILRHFNLKPFNCPQCDFNASNQTIYRHQTIVHGKTLPALTVKIPKGRPTVMQLDLTKAGRRKVGHFCLLCDKSFLDDDKDTHVHPNREPQFVQVGDNVYKCQSCDAIRKTISGFREHHNGSHPNKKMNYTIERLADIGKLVCKAPKCNRQFATLSGITLHHNAKHPSTRLKYESLAPVLAPVSAFTEKPVELSDDDAPARTKRRYSNAFKTPPKMVAKKSTTKLPFSNSVARKSTTKLPFLTYDDRLSETSDSDQEEEYSYYGTKPPSLTNYSQVTTLMPFLNTVMPFTLKKLSEFVNITPRVEVKDIAKS